MRTDVTRSREDMTLGQVTKSEMGDETALIFLVKA